MVSRRFGVIFVHVPKTAGQSIESVFLEREGLGWENRAPLLLRIKAKGAPGPHRLAHLYADEYLSLEYVSAAKFAHFFKFAVVRDPYTRAVSEYRYRSSRGRFELSIEEFLRLDSNPDSDEGRHMAPQSRFIFDKSGACLVDKVLRFENLESEFAVVAQQIFGATLHLPRANVTKGPPLELTANQRAMIAERYADDFARFDYPP